MCKDKSASGWKLNIALFLSGQGVTLFGSMLVHYAVMWHITLKTQSSLIMAFVAIAGALPIFFISPFGGVWADRYNKKHIINIADASIAAFTLVMACLFSAGVEYTMLLLICLAMRALGQGVQTPAVNALIPVLVPQEHLTRINGISGSIQSLVLFASPMAGGALLSVAPIQTLMFIDVITAAIGIGILQLFVKIPVQPQKNEIKTGAKQYFVEIGEGLKYVGKSSFLKSLIIIAAIYNFMIAPAAILTPLQVAREWGEGVWVLFGGIPLGPEQRLAVIEIAYFIGMSLGGFLMGVWGGLKNKSHSMMISMVLQGVCTIGFGLLNDFVLYSICMFLIGILVPLFTAPLMSILQTKVDSNFMGRIFSVLHMMSSLMMPLGMVLWGPLGDTISIDWLLIVTGAWIFLMGFAFKFNRTLRKVGEAAEN